MSTAEIVRVWGRADEVDLVFRHISGNDWAVNVPPDLSDGQYACEIHAENNYGERAMWTGILYMHCGNACLHLAPSRFVLWLLPEGVVLHAAQDSRILQMTASITELQFVPNRYTIAYKEDCICGRTNV